MLIKIENMESKIIVISHSELVQYLLPIVSKLEKIEAYMSGEKNKNEAIYNDTDASHFLKVSKKKLQQLRNSRRIGFVRENDGRRILYKHEHLMEYLQTNELKRRK